METTPALNERQKRFCEEYVIDFNAAQAAIRAGYKPANARSTGYKLLQYPDIDAYIVQLKAERRRQNAELAEHIKQELITIAFADGGDMLNLTGENPVLDVRNPNTTKALASASVTKSKSKDSSTCQVQFKMHDKVAALKVLAKYLGMFDEKPVDPAECISKTYRPAPTLYQITEYEKTVPEGLPEETGDGIVM